MAMNVLGGHAAFAVWQHGTPAAAGAAVAGLVLWVLWRWFIQSEKAQGCAQPFLWVVAGVGVLMVLGAGAYLAISEYSKSDPRASQDGLIVLVLAGIFVGVGGLLWIARTREGGRLVVLLWLSARFIGVCLVLALMVLGILFGFPKHH